MPHRSFGIFEPLFGDGAPYLSLLHLSNKGAKEIVSQVVSLARSSTNPYEEIGALFDDRNWRPHLVGAVALADLDYDASSFVKLWRAIDTGSWVTPQLTVAAFLRDTNFVLHAQTRLENFCPIDTTLLFSTTPLERHFAAGLAGGRHRSAKMAAALIHLLRLMQQIPDWLAPTLEVPELQKLVKDDFDNSGELAETWLTEIRTLLPN
jgi:hypothetical protein